MLALEGFIAFIFILCKDFMVVERMFNSFLHTLEHYGDTEHYSSGGRHGDPSGACEAIQCTPRKDEASPTILQSL